MSEGRDHATYEADGCVMRRIERCWWCNGRLTLFPSRPNEGVEVIDPLGNKHRVHKCCRSAAEAEFKLWKEWE